LLKDDIGRLAADFRRSAANIRAYRFLSRVIDNGEEAAFGKKDFDTFQSIAVGRYIVAKFQVGE
jgi:hypothetical protein